MAKATFNASMPWSGKGVYCEGGIRGFQLAVDEPASFGGTDKAMNPVELLLCSLGGCLSICAAAFASKCQVDLKGFSVELEGDLDTAGFPGEGCQRAEGIPGNPIQDPHRFSFTAGEHRQTRRSDRRTLPSVGYTGGSENQGSGVIERKRRNRADNTINLNRTSLYGFALSRSWVPDIVESNQLTCLSHQDYLNDRILPAKIRETI